MQVRRVIQPGHQDCEHPVQIALQCPWCEQAFHVHLIVHPRHVYSEERVLHSLIFHSKHEHRYRWLLLLLGFYRIQLTNGREPT